jgi:hypothetical protein
MPLSDLIRTAETSLLIILWYLPELVSTNVLVYMATSNQPFASAWCNVGNILF